MRRLLGEHALEAEHERVAGRATRATARAGRRPSRRAPRRARGANAVPGREHDVRVLVGGEEGLAGPCLGPKGRGRDAVGRLQGRSADCVSCLLQCARHACRAASLRLCSRSPPPASYRLTPYRTDPGLASPAKRPARAVFRRCRGRRRRRTDCPASPPRRARRRARPRRAARAASSLGLLARRDAGDHVRPAPHDAVALRPRAGRRARAPRGASGTGSAPPTARSRPRRSPPRSSRRAARCPSGPRRRASARRRPRAARARARAISASIVGSARSSCACEPA